MSKGGLKNDVVSIAVRPRPIRKRRERLLVKLCGGEEKRFSKVKELHPSSPEMKNSHCPLMIYLRFKTMAPN